MIEEEGKPIRIERGRPVYLREHPEINDWWTVYQLAASNMRSLAYWKAKRKKSVKSKTGRAGCPEKGASP